MDINHTRGSESHEYKNDCNDTISNQTRIEIFSKIYYWLAYKVVEETFQRRKGIYCRIARVFFLHNAGFVQALNDVMTQYQD